MRKLKLQVQMSVDGFVAGPNGELDWMTWNWDDKLKDFVNELHESVDTILLGRKMAQGFIEHWDKVSKNPEDESHLFGKKMTDTPKVIFTKTLEKPEDSWANTALAKDDLVEEVDKLKKSEGSDIIVYGGAGFVSSLIKAGLIDELNLFVNPVILGKGMTIFGQVDERQNLKLVKTTPFECGIVVLTYNPGK